MFKKIFVLHVLIFCLMTSHGEGVGISKNEPARMEWVARCKKNPITDARQCDAIHVVNGNAYYYEDEIILIFWIHEKQHGTEIVVNADIYPSSTIAIRVDKKPPIFFKSNKGIVPPNQSKVLLSQLFSGEVVTIQYYDWPYNSQVNREVNLGGLKSTFDDMKKSILNPQ